MAVGLQSFCTINRNGAIGVVSNLSCQMGIMCSAVIVKWTFLTTFYTSGCQSWTGMCLILACPKNTQSLKSHALQG